MEGHVLCPAAAQVHCKAERNLSDAAGSCCGLVGHWRWGLPVRVHADLSFDCDVLSWDQSFENAAFVREGLESQIPHKLCDYFFYIYIICIKDAD